MNSSRAISFALVFAMIYPLSLRAQPGQEKVQNPSTPSLPSADKATKPGAGQDQEKFRLVLSGNFTRYVEELNRLGKMGYRLEKAFNYGGDSSLSQRYAAVLELDSEETFEYDWLTSPNKRFLESRLNFNAERGFNPVQLLPLTSCSDKEIDEDTQIFPVGDLLLRLTKGDVFLLERRNGKAKKAKEYKVFIGKIGLGKSPTAELQAALDNAPAGFHPFKILFNKSGIFDFSVSVLLEKDLKNVDAGKVQYRFFKDVNGFEKEINSLAQIGFHLIAGRRIGLLKFALLAKVPGDAASYILLDADKHQKEFLKKVAPGDIYKGMFLGDTSCDEPETRGAKLVFARTAAANQRPEYKFLKLADRDLYPTEDSSTAELNRLLKENYRVRDVFYSRGPTVILER